MLAEFGVHDTKELLAYWDLPLVVAPPPSEESVRRAFENAGYEVVHFLKLRRAGNQYNELALRRQSAFRIVDNRHLTGHVLEILATAGLEMTEEEMKVSQRGDRVWLSFARLLPAVRRQEDRYAFEP
jgi:hypothetical protein